MFTPTDRQRTGLENMERFCGIRQPRTEFADRDEFQAYWTLVAARGNATQRSREGETASSREAKRREAQIQLTAHYQNDDALTRYARDYLQRYQPSSGKLRQKLLEKSGHPELVDAVMARLEESLDDSTRIRELAEIMQRQGRHAQAIRAKLRQRLFPAPFIDDCLQSLTEAGAGTLLDASALARNVLKLQRKGLSQRAMSGKLSGGSGDSRAVKAALQETLGAEGDTQALRTAYAKLARKPYTPQEFTRRLLAKGFRYGDITRLLADLAEK